jgi:hypothetical protein
MGGKESCIQGFGGGNLREGDHLKDSDVEGRKILKWIFEMWDGAQDRSTWRVFMNAVMNFRSL